MPAANEKSLGRIAVTAMAGASIEWYDFFVYGTAAALVFPSLFFPASLSPFVAQLAAFSTFAVGFVARPLGGVVFGHFGDLFGRKRALVTALVMMGLATTSVGLLPTYAKAGPAAPLLLVALRFVQGFAIGGQWGGAALLAIESAPSHRRGFYGSFVQMGVPVGVVLANIVFAVSNAALTPTEFQAWGWRVPFLLSIVLVMLGLYVQLRLEDSPEFTALEEKGENASPARRSSPILEALRRHAGTIVLAGGAFLACNGCFYLVITYAVSYGASTLHIPKTIMLLAVMIGSLCMLPALMLFAALSDRFGRRGLFMTGALLTGAFSFAFFPMIETGSLVEITAAMVIALFLLSMMYGPQAALFAELFTAEIRYSGASLGYQLGAILGGGFAPMIATALFAEFHSSRAMATYMFAMCVISFICTAALVALGARARSAASQLQPGS